MKMSKLVVFIFLLVTALCHGRDEVSAKIPIVHEVTPGVWSDNFTNALAVAKSAHKPILVISAGTECSFCYRLNKSMNSTDFKMWQDDRKIFMVHINDKNPQFKQTEAFQREGFKEVTGIPIVCVYWKKEDGTEVKRTFSGRRGTMPGIRHKFLQMELISALDKILIDYTAKLSNPKEILHSPDSKYFKFTQTGGSGKIEMDPVSGELADERGTVVITAIADDSGSVFWGWMDPNGRCVGYARKLVIDSGMTEGTYTANFRNVSACRPPVFSVPEQPIIAKVGKKFKFRLEVEEATRPMKFSAEGMPFGLSLDSEEGVFSGTLWRKGCYNITVTAEGRDVAATKVVREFQLVVEAKRAED
ncbi:MAG: putative Ig domain-containing protein [Kiritimatiellae bacterium]|nr:putative Ig domain-containing protein [Kiritimatiellia bacterium]